MMAAAEPSQVAGLSRFFKTGPGQYGEGDRFLGIKVPVTRSIVCGCWSAVTVENLQECISSEYHEVRLSALLTLVQIYKHAKARSSRSGQPDGRATAFSTDVDLKKFCVDFYLSNLEYINNWDLVDLSCYEILGRWFLDHDRSLLYELARNGSTIWERRIGIVSTMAFIRAGQLDDTYAIADIFLDESTGCAGAPCDQGRGTSHAISNPNGGASCDQGRGTGHAISSTNGGASLHDLLQKAVGWLLREAGKRDESRLKDWLEPRRASMPRTMLRYSIEKLSPADKAHFMSRV